MPYLFAGLLFGIFVSSGTVTAEEPPDARCIALAKEFGQNPGSLSLQELERLRFCLHQTLEYREQNLKGEVLKGTIIEPPSHSGRRSGTKPSSVPKNPETIP